MNGLNIYQRTEPVIAIGGGVCLDIVGLASSLFCHKTPYTRGPTTAPSYVDASVGAKSGCNFVNSKNRLGAYVPPVAARLGSSSNCRPPPNQGRQATPSRPAEAGSQRVVMRIVLGGEVCTASSGALVLLSAVARDCLLSTDRSPVYWRSSSPSSRSWHGAGFLRCCSWQLVCWRHPGPAWLAAFSKGLPDVID